jgi:hypothetical protein
VRSLLRAGVRGGPVLVVALFALGAPGSLRAQQAPLPDSTFASPNRISPGGAFFRSALVPGWGHVATGAYGRAGFYVAAEGASAWMLLQTLTRRREAKTFLREERQLARARLEASGVTDPQELDDGVDNDPLVQDRQTLLDSRNQQVEDWQALSIFLVLLGGADAFVAAHLADYPEPLSIQVQPNAAGAIELRLSLPLAGGP